MNAAIKVVSEIARVAKNGNKYREVWCEITIGNFVFMRKFVIFE